MHFHLIHLPNKLPAPLFRRAVGKSPCAGTESKILYLFSYHETSYFFPSLLKDKEKQEEVKGLDSQNWAYPAAVGGVHIKPEGTASNWQNWSRNITLYPPPCTWLSQQTAEEVKHLKGNLPHEFHGNGYFCCHGSMPKGRKQEKIKSSLFPPCSESTCCCSVLMNECRLSCLNYHNQDHHGYETLNNYGGSWIAF